MLTNNTTTLWEKLKLLLYKNCCMLLCTWEQRIQFIMTMLTPMLVCCTLVILRFLVHVEHVPITQHPPIDLDEAWTNLIELLAERKVIMNKENPSFTYDNFVPRLIIIYAPANVTVYQNIMEHAAQHYLQNIELNALLTCDDLRQFMLVDYYLAGVCFNYYSDNDNNDNYNNRNKNYNNKSAGIYPSELRYSLMFPSELRIYHDTYIGSDWNTKRLFDFHGHNKRRSSTYNDGGYLGYAREGFLPLQNAISTSYLKLLPSDTDEILPQVSIQRFPYHQYDNDPLTDGITKSLSFIIMLGFAYPTIHLIKSIVSEKEKQLKDMLEIMNVPNWLQFSAWFVIGIVSMSIGSILMLFVLKIHWHEGFSILQESSVLPLLVFLFAYSVANVSFSLMMSSFFTRTTPAITMSHLIWLLSYIPYMLTINDSIANNAIKLCMCLLSNTVMGFAFQGILNFERFGKGFRWYDFFDTYTIDDDFNVGIYTLILYALSIVYICVGLYFETLHSCLPAICNNILFNKRMPDIQLKDFSLRMSKVQEVEAMEKTLTIQMTDVCMQYKNTPVLKNVSMSIYEGDITAIMGHNAAGKTTLMSIVSGLIKPTSGNVIINSFDINQYPMEARSNMGVYINNNVLFDDLTVGDQLMFFSRMKGMSKENAKQEVENFLSDMHLLSNKHMLTRNLTAGLRQYLAVCCALAGNTKIVLLDMPSSCMDPYTTQQFWETIYREKQERTILMTTHSGNEVDALADRVAIIAGGELKCYGSTFFLNTVYGRGCRLSCTKTSDCNAEAITDAIQTFIPDILPECNIGTELSYTLDEQYANLFGDILDHLEENASELKITGCSISNSNIEDIFFAMGAENSSDGNRLRYSEIMNGRSIYYEEYQRLHSTFKYTTYTGIKRWLCHCQGMLLKHIIMHIRNMTTVLLIELLMPLLLISLTFLLSQDYFTKNETPPMTFSLTQYRETQTIIEEKPGIHGFSQNCAEEYKAGIFWDDVGHHFEYTNDRIFSTYIIEKQLAMEDNINHRYQVAATFGQENIVAWFNNYPLHTAPLSLNMIHNAMVRALLDKNAKIVVTLEPIEYRETHYSTLMTAPINIGNYLAVILALSLNYSWAIWIIFLVIERRSRFKLMQFISGTCELGYWLTNLLHAFIIIITESLIILLCLIAFHHNFSNARITGWYYLVLVIAGLSTRAFHYLLSILCRNGIIAYSLAVGYGIFGIGAYFAFTEVLGRGHYELLHKPYTPEWHFYIFPHFLLCKALFKIFVMGEVHESCTNKNLRDVAINLEKCKISPNCCRDFSIWNWDTGIATEVIALLIIGIVFWLLLCLIENRSIWRSEKCCNFISDASGCDEAESEKRTKANDDSVFQEQQRVCKVQPSEYADIPLLCHGIGKHFGDISAIRSLYFLVERGECFGLTGINGAGKTIILNLLTGAAQLSFGSVYVSGISLKQNITEMHKHIGYCPQYEFALPEYYTAKEVLRILCLLRGIQKQKIPKFTESLSKLLSFYTHFNTIIRHLSAGTKRRLSFAIAIIGNPDVVYLDEPSMNIDLAGRRLLWNIITYLRSRGQSIVLGSLNMMELECVCDRLAILSHGNLLAIGTAQELCEKYANGYLLKIKLKPITRRDTVMFLKLATFMENEYPNSFLKNRVGHVIIYLLPLEHTSISRIFKNIRRNTFNLNIEHFCITRSTLTFVFMDCAEEEFKHQSFS